MNTEWTKIYLRDLSQYRDTILKNCLSLTETPPRYLLKENFSIDYFRLFENNLKNDYTSNPYIKFSNYQEYRILKLIHFLNKARVKFLNYKQEEKFSTETSQLVMINNIIKNSNELTSCVYLVEWLQSIYSKEDPTKIVKKDKTFFEQTAKIFHQKHLKFNPDNLNFVNNDINPLEQEAYSKISEIMVFFIRQGKLSEAQQFAEHQNQHFLSAMLNGGLPLNDFLIDKAESLNIDFDLFLPFMKNKDLKELQENLQSYRQVQNIDYQNVINLHDGVVGNPNWILWFNFIYEACEVSDNQRLDHLKHMQSYLSGNPKILDVSQNLNIHETLYNHTNSFLNIKTISEYLSKERIDYYPVECPSVLNLYNKIKNKSLCDIVNLIKTQEVYNQATNKDFLIEIELQLVLLHFSRSEEFLYNFNELLKLIIHVLSSEKFDSYIKSHVGYIETSILNKNENKMSRNEQFVKTESNILLLKINYCKIIFSSIVNFYATNLQNLKLCNDGLLNDVVQNYDRLISLFFFEILKLTIDPLQCVYILSFCLNMQTVVENLTYLANQITDPNQYKILVGEIDKHFQDHLKNLNTNIALNTNIYTMPKTLVSIDDIFKRDLKEKLSIHPDDQNKIEQIKYLFLEGKLDTNTVCKYILKLFIKFLSNHKFNEAFMLKKTIHDINHNLFDIWNVLNHDLIKAHNLEKDEKNFYYLMDIIDQNIFDKFQIDYSTISIYFIIIFINSIIDIYFSYLNLNKDMEKLSNDIILRRVKVNFFLKF